MARPRGLGYTFRDPTLLDAALTHRSFAHEAAESATPHYERLEFLGDALTGFLVSDWLVRNDRDCDEGELTRRRQSVIRTETLADAARRVGLGDRIRLGRGEEATGGRLKPSILADTFEAVVAAVYLDGGLRSARAFTLRHLRSDLEAALGGRHAVRDHKSELQEELQARVRKTPRYRISAKTGPAHAPEFEAEVLVDARVLGRGRGASRKLAEQEAAREALETLESAEREGP